VGCFDVIGRFVGALLCDWSLGVERFFVIGRAEKEMGWWWAVLCCDWSRREGDWSGLGCFAVIGRADKWLERATTSNGRWWGC